MLPCWTFHNVFMLICVALLIPFTISVIGKFLLMIIFFCSLILNSLVFFLTTLVHMLMVHLVEMSSGHIQSRKKTDCWIYEEKNNSQCVQIAMNTPNQFTAKPHQTAKGIHFIESNSCPVRHIIKGLHFVTICPTSRPWKS